MKTVLMILSKPSANDVRVQQEKEVLEGWGFTVDIEEYSRTDAMAPVVWIFRMLCRFWFIKKYDIYHCHDLDTLLLGILLKFRHRAKLVYDSHEFFLQMIKRDRRKYLYPYFWVVEKIGVLYADRIIQAVPGMYSYTVKNTK